MKVKTKQTLPFVEIGSVGTWNSGNLVFHDMCFLLTKGEIEAKPDWFEIIEDAPVWANEEWSNCISSEGKGAFISTSPNRLGYKIDDFGKERAKLIAAAPDMWRFIEAFTKTTKQDFNHYSTLVEANKLLNKIK